MPLQLEIVTPEKMVLSKEVDTVNAPGLQGAFGVLPGHIPFFTALKVGSLHYEAEGKTEYVFVSGGFAEVSDNKVSILAEVAEKSADIDRERAKKSLERAKERMENQEKYDTARLKASLSRALGRLQCCDR